MLVGALGDRIECGEDCRRKPLSPKAIESPVRTVFDDVMQYASDALLCHGEAEHDTKRVQNVGSASLVGLTGVGFGGDGDCSFESAHWRPLKCRLVLRQHVDHDRPDHRGIALMCGGEPSLGAVENFALRGFASIPMAMGYGLWSCRCPARWTRRRPLETSAGWPLPGASAIQMTRLASCSLRLKAPMSPWPNAQTFLIGT